MFALEGAWCVLSCRRVCFGTAEVMFPNHSPDEPGLSEKELLADSLLSYSILDLIHASLM